MFTNVDLDYWAKTHYQPIFLHYLGAVLQYLAIFYKKKTALNPEIWSEKRKNFNKISNVSDPGTEKLMLVMCACGLHNCVMTS